PQPALMANQVCFYAAVGVEKTRAARPDAGEDLEVYLVRPEELESMIDDGRIHNAMTVTALALARRAGLF
ncbi:MAG: hypothetical protein AB1896_17235, partial [Thermodesulfobacteriota bacterium]